MNRPFASFGLVVLLGCLTTLIAQSGKLSDQEFKQVAQSHSNAAEHQKLAAHYTSERFFTYTNDQKVPSVTLVDLSLGYRFQGDGWTKGLEVQVNATNLFDKTYISTIGSNGFGYSGDSQTLLTGAPQQVFVTARKTF